MSAKVYKYGLLPPVQGRDEIEKQLRLGWEYRRDLTAGPLRTERSALRASRSNTAAVKAAQKEVKRLGAQLDKLVLKQKKQQQKTRKRSAPPELNAEIKAIRKERGAAKKVLRAARVEAKDVAKSDVITTRFNTERKKIRSGYVKNGLYWGTYQSVDESVNQANSTTNLYDLDAVTPKDPRYPNWNGSGRVSVHIQGRVLTAAEVLAGTSLYLQINRVPDLFLEARGRGKKRCGGGTGRAEFGQLWLRVGSDPEDNKIPIWGVWPIKLHRPLPSSARIKAASVTLRYVGPRPVWTAEITVEEQDAVKEPCGNGTVAIDLGWSQQPNGVIRTAYWRNSEGQHGSFDLSAGLVSALRYAEELQATRDKLRDVMVEKLIQHLGSKMPKWLRDCTGKRGVDTPTLAEAQAMLRKWRSAARWWRISEDPRWGKKGCPDLLTLWVIKDKHLWEWERNQSEKAHNRRKDEYRVWAAQLTRRYSTVVVEAEVKQRRGTSVPMDLSKLARRPKPEDKAENETARSNRQIAAPGELRLAILQAAKARGCKVALEPAQDTTRECPFKDCRHVDTYEASKISERPACSKCGRSWPDIDDGACVVLLRRHDTAVRDKTVKYHGQGVKPSRYERRRKAMLAKQLRMQQAVQR